MFFESIKPKEKRNKYKTKIKVRTEECKKKQRVVSFLKEVLGKNDTR